MKKKVFLVSLAATALFALSACSNSQALDDDLVTLKGGSITIGDYYDQIKANNADTLQGMIIYKVFDNAYGDKVTDKAVQKEYDNAQESYGGKKAFNAALKQYGYTEKSYKADVRQRLAYQKGLESNVKLTDKEMKTAWENFHPEVETQIIQLTDEDKAKDVKKQLDDGGDFAKLAKENSASEDDSEVKTTKFDSSSTTVPAEVMTAAFALDDDAYSDVITATDANYGNSTYYIVKMIKNVDKGDDMDKYKKEVKAAATATKVADSTFVNETITKELKAANVKIKDDDFSDLLANYLTSDSSTADSKKESSSKESESSTADSSTAESSTSDSAAESSSTAESSSAE